MASEKTGRDFPTMATDEVYEIAGGYPVIRLLGEGGMGRVYACRDQALGRVVAVKVMLAETARDPEMVKRFVREARAMARVSSPHVVSIFDVGGGTEGKGPPWIVMEHLDGENLEARLERTRTVPVARTLDYMRDAAHGLRAANQAGVIHRDVKPANFIVTDGRVVLTDFGLAKPVDGSADLTTKGVIAGSPHYMPPERIRGEEEDHRSDMYSLGATWYQLLTGTPPFPKGTPVATVTAHLSEEPAPADKVSPDVPREVAAIVDRLLKKDPAERYQTYDELLDAIAKAVTIVDPASAPPEKVAPEKPPPRAPAPVEVAAPREQATLKERLADVSARFSGAIHEVAARPKWQKSAAIVAPIAAGLVIALLFALASEDRLARIDDGEAREVLEEIAKKPIGERGPEDDLMRGHAHAKLDEDKQALAAYVAAAEKGLVDERVLDYALSRLKERHAKEAMKLLVAWPDDKVTPKLLALLDSPEWFPRHHGLRVLEERGEDDDVDKVRLALVDLETGEKCGLRKYGLGQLKLIGKGDDVLQALDKAAEREDNGCLHKDIAAAKRAVEERQ